MRDDRTCSPKAGVPASTPGDIPRPVQAPGKTETAGMSRDPLESAGPGPQEPLCQVGQWARKSVTFRP